MTDSSAGSFARATRVAPDRRAFGRARRGACCKVRLAT